MAAGLARTEPSRHRHDAWLRRRQTVARAPQEGSRLAPVHRRTAGRSGLRWVDPGRSAASPEAERGAELHGHVQRRAALRAADLREHRERADEEARLEVSRER